MQSTIWEISDFRALAGRKVQPQIVTQLMFKSDVTNAILEEAAEQTRREIRAYCRMERHRPFTLNRQYYISMQHEWLTTYALKRHNESRSDCTLASTPCSSIRLTDSTGNPRIFQASEENLCTVLSAFGIHLSSLKQLARIHHDDYDDELGVISHITSYFEISSKRLIDDIPKVFETVFACDFGQELERNLAMNLKLVGEGGVETCKRYIQDEPDVQFKRDDLMRQAGILKNALTTVDHFHKGISY
jgi:hypothetical protein